MKSYFIYRNGKQEGPYDVATIQRMRLSNDVFVWCEGMADWQPITSVPDLQQQQVPPQFSQQTSQQVPPQEPPRYQQAYQQPTRYADEKNKVTAGILALLLGGLGIHYFYLGKTTGGIVFLLLCCTGIPALLAFIQGILMLTMTDEQFLQKYVYTESSFPLF